MIPHAEEPFGMTVPLEVKHLILNAGMHPHEYYGINFMLKSCPSLQTLTINIGPGRRFPVSKSYIDGINLLLMFS